MSNCPFCHPNRDNLDIVWEPKSGSHIIVINPLNPVTREHVLVINTRAHTYNASTEPTVTADLMWVAAEYVRHLRGLNPDFDANIITSIGPAATQTVFHTHLHVVPRRIGDGLHLPWTGQVKE